MLVKFKINKKELRTDIPVIPLVGEKITINESAAYVVKSIEHELNAGSYNTCIMLSAAKKKVSKKKTIAKK